MKHLTAIYAVQVKIPRFPASQHTLLVSINMMYVGTTSNLRHRKTDILVI